MQKMFREAAVDHRSSTKVCGIAGSVDSFSVFAPSKEPLSFRRFRLP